MPFVGIMAGMSLSNDYEVLFWDASVSETTAVLEFDFTGASLDAGGGKADGGSPTGLRNSGWVVAGIGNLYTAATSLATTGGTKGAAAA